MNCFSRLARPLPPLLIALVMTACGGGGGDDGSPGPQPSPLPPGTVGPAGGTVTGANGAQVVVPAGALNQNVTISITQSSTGAPALPAGHVPIGQMFAFQPHGTSFASPVTVTVPFDAAQLPAGERAIMLKTNAAQTAWEEVSGVTISGGNASASIGGFSWIFMSRLPPPVVAVDEPQRYYEFGGWNVFGNYTRIEGNFPALEAREPGEPPGDLDKTIVFGGLAFTPPGGDMNASGGVYSNEEGKVYWVGAEAPTGDLMGLDPNATFLGGKSSLRQFQSYRKNAANATMEIVITRATHLIADFNGSGPRLAGCPWSGAPENVPEDCADLLTSQLFMRVQTVAGTGVDITDDREVYSVVKGATMIEHLGSNGVDFDVYIPDEAKRTPVAGQTNRFRALFAENQFDRLTVGGQTQVTLREPLRVQIDLSRIPVCSDESSPVNCPEFTLQTEVDALAQNRRSAETYAAAFLRDPLGLGGEVEVITTGLTPTNRPYLGTPTQPPQPQPTCESGTNPDSGAIQFDRERVRIMEFGELKPQVYITRTGGSAGEVIANITTQADTAIPGTHFQSVTNTVIFGDGDDTPRALALPTIDNNTHDGNKRFTLQLVAQPACARLGDDTTLEVMIVDDEARPVVNTNPSGSLDLTFSDDGKADSGSFGGPPGRMAMQPDGKFVLVGGSFVAFNVARFNHDGTPDTGFGGTGQVTTDVTGTSGIQYARAVTMQPDGKIVVAGDYDPPGTLSAAAALVRYNADGTLDSSFSGDGILLEPAVGGNVMAVALQADGRIVVAGSFPVSGNVNDLADAMLARFNADGTLDSSFGSAGVKVFDVVGSTDQLRNLLIQSDGSIFTSGEPAGGDPSTQTIVAKLDASGNFDDAFDGDGRMGIPGANVGYGLALQPDGKLLLAGGTTSLPSSFAVVRLNADGSYDSSFGNGGAVTTVISGRTDGRGDYARAVAVAPDGRIYAAGVYGNINSNFGLVRYTPTGALDTSFANTGFIHVDFNGLQDYAESVVIQGDGRIVLGGVAFPTTRDGFGVVRINP